MQIDERRTRADSSAAAKKGDTEKSTERDEGVVRGNSSPRCGEQRIGGGQISGEIER